MRWKLPAKQNRPENIKKSRFFFLNKKNTEKSIKRKRGKKTNRKSKVIMITNRVQGDYIHNEVFGQQTTNASNDQIKYNHSIYDNRHRNKHTILLLLAILICKCCAVIGDTTGKHYAATFFFYSTLFSLFRIRLLSFSIFEWE